MDRTAVEAAVRKDLDAVPHARGVNNHMGSLYTRHPGNLRWVMDALRGGRLLLRGQPDHGTQCGGTGGAGGRGARHPAACLPDHDRDPEMIRHHLERLVRHARRHGYGLAIGHPYPETLAVLEEVLPEWARAGIKLVPASRLVELYGQEEENVP